MLRLLLVLFLAGPGLAGDFVDGFEVDINTDGLPDGWYRYFDAQTHPLYNPIGLVDDAKHVREGKRSLRLATRGGNVSLVSAVPSPLLPRVDPRKTYTLNVWAMTEGLATSRAFATVEWLNDRGVPLPPRQKTEAIGASRAWVRLEARFESIPEEARFVRFGLHIEGNDLSGAAWFDDLTWREEVRIRVQDLARRGFVVREGKTARIEASCEDLDVGAYDLAFEAREYDGRAVPISVAEAESERVLRVGSEGEASHALRIGGSRSFQARYRIEGMRTGFLELVLSLRRDGQEVARRRVGFISPPDRFYVAPQESTWGVEIGTETDPVIVDRLAELHLGHARVLFWTGAPEREAELSRTGVIDELLYRLTRSGFTVGGSLETPPPEFLPQGTPQAGMAQFLSGSQASWEPALRLAFKKYRETILEWRLGGTGDRGYEGRQGLDDLARRVRTAISADLPNVEVTFPLPIGDAASGAAQLATSRDLAGVDYFLPADLDERTAEALLRTAAMQATKSSVTIGPSEAGESIPAQAAALWRLAGIATHKGIRRLAVTDIVSQRSGLYDLEGTPTALAGSLWTLHAALGQMKPLELDGYEPIEHVVEKPERPRMISQLVFRNSSRKETSILVWLADEGPSITIPVYLGHALKALRVDGRALPLAPSAGGVTRVTLSREPILLYDVDTELFETLRTMKFSPDTVDSASGPQTVKLVFVNKFATKMSLKGISVRFPPHWKETSLGTKEVAAGEPDAIDVPIQVPESQVLDTAKVTIGLSFEAGRSYEGIQVRLGLKVASESGVTLEVTPRWEANALAIEVKLKNGNRPSRYVVSIGLGEGYPVLTDPTGTIPRDQPWTRTYHVPASDALVGRTIRVKLNEAQTTTFLSKAVEVPPRD